MKKLLAALGIVTLALTATACAPEPDTRTERVALYLHAIHAEDSELIADYMADDGLYDTIAADLVELCDGGSSSPYAYASAFDETSSVLSAAIVDSWDIACPE